MPLRNSRRPLRYVLLAAAIVCVVYLHQSIVYNERLRGGIFDYSDAEGGKFDYVEEDIPKGWGKTNKIHAIRSSYNWAKLPRRNAIPSTITLPKGKPHSLPRIQHVFPRESRATIIQLDSQRQAVRRSFQRCWKSYKKYAWMRDELSPISAAGKDTFGGWAATLIDSLDTLWILRLEDEFQDAVAAVATIDWANTTGTSCNIFETTIRHLGGLLAAYDLSDSKVLLDKAIELGDMLYAGFDTPNGMPPFWLDFESAKRGNLQADSNEPIASPGSLSLEFTRLSQITMDPKYYAAISRVTDLLEEHQNSTKIPGMWPTMVDMRNEKFDQRSFSIGALADSLYEYFPKMHALVGGLNPVYEKLSILSLDAITKYSLFRPMLADNADVLFAGDVYAGENGVNARQPEGQHLSCFAGGMYALSGRLFDREDHVDLGVRLARGCSYAYAAFPTGIMPEIFNMLPCDSLDGCEWDQEIWEKKGNQKLPKGFINARDPSYLLRPEAIESVFLLYRITGMVEFRDAAWDMFQSIQNATETEFGNARIDDVTVSDSPPNKRDSMEVRNFSFLSVALEFARAAHFDHQFKARITMAQHIFPLPSLSNDDGSLYKSGLLLRLCIISTAVVAIIVILGLIYGQLEALHQWINEALDNPRRPVQVEEKKKKPKKKPKKKGKEVITTDMCFAKSAEGVKRIGRKRLLDYLEGHFIAMHEAAGTGSGE
ncbi:putative mannosyl-oligosaccharide alpha-1,2-mannosidase 1B [Lachnellula suecica]|uniref:alpha-1,2-Mannosidase n=1 Tax=Lachnellula suecica TaxID=602035 RepID=A0A8T9C634_9HELO|nr:putative mannosyl-oligosaccharide alpha-1,2-mannosidase 1B [Lachnellula suecica]